MFPTRRSSDLRHRYNVPCRYRLRKWEMYPARRGGKAGFGAKSVYGEATEQNQRVAQLARDEPGRPGREVCADPRHYQPIGEKSEEHTYELQSLMRNSSDVFCLEKKNKY